MLLNFPQLKEFCENTKQNPIKIHSVHHTNLESPPGKLSTRTIRYNGVDSIELHRYEVLNGYKAALKKEWFEFYFNRVFAFFIRSPQLIMNPTIVAYPDELTVSEFRVKFYGKKYHRPIQQVFSEPYYGYKPLFSVNCSRSLYTRDSEVKVIEIFSITLSDSKGPIFPVVNYETTYTGNTDLTYLKLVHFELQVNKRFANIK